MNDGRPVGSVVSTVFRQGDVDETDEQSGVPVEPRTQVDRLHNQLVYSESYKETPVFEGQAKVYPDTVKVVDERYRIFDVSSPAHMDEYSKILLSNRVSGRFVVTSEEMKEWDGGTCRIVIRVQERMFKTLSTVELTPTEA